MWLNQTCIGLALSFRLVQHAQYHIQYQDWDQMRSCLNVSLEELPSPLLSSYTVSSFSRIHSHANSFLFSIFSNPLNKYFEQSWGIDAKLIKNFQPENSESLVVHTHHNYMLVAEGIVVMEHFCFQSETNLALVRCFVLLGCKFVLDLFEKKYFCILR